MIVYRLTCQPRGRLFLIAVGRHPVASLGFPDNDDVKTVAPLLSDALEGCNQGFPFLQLALE